LRLESHSERIVRSVARRLSDESLLLLLSLELLLVEVGLLSGCLFASELILLGLILEDATREREKVSVRPTEGQGGRGKTNLHLEVLLLSLSLLLFEHLLLLLLIEGLSVRGTRRSQLQPSSSFARAESGIRDELTLN